MPSSRPPCAQANPPAGGSQKAAFVSARCRTTVCLAKCVFEEVVVANREQRSNREKKKPKADQKAKPVQAKPPGYVEPQLVRKPHKGKDWV